MVKNDQPSAQEWSKENTAAYISGHQLQLHDQDKEPIIDCNHYLDGQLTSLRTTSRSAWEKLLKAQRTLVKNCHTL